MAKKYREMNVFTMDEEKKRKGYAQVAQGVFGARIVEEKSADSTSGNSGTNRATIGSTTIPTRDAEIIRKEVRDTMAKVFPRIQTPIGSIVQPNPLIGTVKTGMGNTEAEVIDLYTGSTPSSAPITIAGSDVSIASTSTNPGNGGNATSFSEMSLGTGVVSHP